MLGLVGGLLYCLPVLLLEIWRHNYIPAAITNTAEFRVWFGIVLFTVGAVLQSIVAAIVTVWVGRLGVVHGLFAAFIAGYVMTAVVCGTSLLLGQSIDLIVVSSVLGWMVNGGAILALLTALVASGLAGWIRHLRSLIRLRLVNEKYVLRDSRVYGLIGTSRH
jgi:hypothetical protein